nr:sigma-70 family RNA polymerase sigma factor [Psychromonas antarctica]
MAAWDENEQLIKNWLLKQTKNGDQAQDILQDTFIKALQNKERFCSLTHAKSWLFTIAKNSLIDSYRKTKLTVNFVPFEPTDEPPEIVNLQQCLLRVLSELSEDDKDILDQCDIQGISQIDYAKHNELTLSATKSRIQRARQKLREQMISSCKVEFDLQGVSSFTPRK